MRKNLIFFILIILGINCIACEPAQFYFDYEELKKNVAQVELIDYNNPDAKEVTDDYKDLQPFDFSKMEIIETLPLTKLDDFLKALSMEGLMVGVKHLDSPNGICIKLSYKNGSFEIFSLQLGYSGSFDLNGKVERFIGVRPNYYFSNKFFETQVGEYTVS